MNFKKYVKYIPFLIFLIILLCYHWKLAVVTLLAHTKSVASARDAFAIIRNRQNIISQIVVAAK